MRFYGFWGKTLRWKYRGAQLAIWVGWHLDLILQKTSSQTTFPRWETSLVNFRNFLDFHLSGWRFDLLIEKSSKFGFSLKLGPTPLEGPLFTFGHWNLALNPSICLWEGSRLGSGSFWTTSLWPFRLVRHIYEILWLLGWKHSGESIPGRNLPFELGDT